MKSNAGHMGRRRMDETYRPMEMDSSEHLYYWTRNGLCARANSKADEWWIIGSSLSFRRWAPRGWWLAIENERNSHRLWFMICSRFELLLGGINWFHNFDWLGDGFDFIFVARVQRVQPFEYSCEGIWLNVSISIHNILVVLTFLCFYFDHEIQLNQNNCNLPVPAGAVKLSATASKINNHSALIEHN